MNFLLALFLVCLGSGSLAMLLAAPRDELGAGFFRLIGFFFGGVLLLGAAIAQPGAEGPPGALWFPLLGLAAVLAVVHALARPCWPRPSSRSLASRACSPWPSR
jgi:hypothetical protein